VTVQPRRFVPPILASAALVAAAPFIGTLQAWLRSALGARFPLAVNLAIGAVAVAAGLIVVRAVRDRYAVRFGALALAVLIAGVFGSGSPGASSATNAVERFHFIEYGIITWLFWRAWRPVNDVTQFVLAALCALAVGTADEALQWYVPRRYGELRDIVLNLASIGAALLVVAAVDPPRAVHMRLRSGSIWRTAVVAATVGAAVALFTQTVHLGHRIDSEEFSMLSRFSAGQLQALARDREVRWRGAAPAEPATWSREDQYWAEGLWHVQARNARWDTDIAAAWGEQRILETYFAPVLAAGHAWPPAQRIDAESRTRRGTRAYVSDAARVRILTWSKPAYWGIVGAALGGLLLLARVVDARRADDMAM